MEAYHRSKIIRVNNAVGVKVAVVVIAGQVLDTNV
jgi:hypothetical protein